MGKQFADVNCSRGAPMGRADDANLETEMPRFVRLFKVRLMDGGYDDGGAYWGIGEPIYCAIDDDGSRQFIRAGSRERAAFMLGLSSRALKVPLFRNGVDYGLALIDGRAPMPVIRRGAWGEYKATKEDVISWLEDCGHHFGRVAA